MGFDWPDTDGVIDKLNEEIIEFVTQTDEGHERACEEFGDIMFTLVNPHDTYKSIQMSHCRLQMINSSSVSGRWKCDKVRRQ